jgi:DNA-binding beta-propeller fold protein YncE
MTNRLGHLIVSGRWDNTVAMVDIEMALAPGNDCTSNAIISRPRVTPDVDTNGDGIPDAWASGQPIIVTVDRQARFAYVVNHSGAATPEAAAKYQHGHPGLITVIDLAAALDPTHSGTLQAVTAFIPTGRTGPTGCGLSPDGRTLFVNCGEAAGSEDGGDEVTAIDLATRKVVRRIPLQETFGHPASGPSKHDSPHPSFGRYANPTGMAISPLKGGIMFVGNGGVSDVSVFDLQAALAGDAKAELCRVPIETGPFGLAASPDGRYVAAAARESMSVAFEGRTISIIDVERASHGHKDAEIARVRVGSDDANEQTRPFAVAFTPDSRRIIASCFRSNSISIVDVADAIAGRPAEALRLYPKAPNGAAPRPRGIVMAANRYACVIGGAKSGPRSSLVWLLDLQAGRIVATVTDVGNESYMLDAIPGTADRTA